MYIKRHFARKTEITLSLSRGGNGRLTGSVAYGLAPGAKRALLLDDRRLLLILVLRALVLHLRLLGVAVLSLVRTGQQLLLHRLLRERAGRHHHAVPVLRLALSGLLVELLHVPGRHARRHRHRRLAQTMMLRRGYAHIPHRLPDDLPDRLEECVAKFRRAESGNRDGFTKGVNPSP